MVGFRLDPKAFYLSDVNQIVLTLRNLNKSFWMKLTEMIQS